MNNNNNNNNNINNNNMPIYTISDHPHHNYKYNNHNDNNNENNSLPKNAVEIAQVAADNAIQSVKIAMSQVQDDSQSKEKEIEKLKYEKELINKKLIESNNILKDVKIQLEMKRNEYKDIVEKNKVIDHRLNCELVAFKKLKDDTALLEQKLVDLENNNNELMSRQVNEKTIRQELLTEIENMQGEINTINLEKSKFQHLFSEIEVKMKIEMENFENERNQWKEQQIKFLQKIHDEEHALQAELQKNQLLRKQINEKGLYAEQVEHQLVSQAKQLKEMQHECVRIRDECIILQENNEKILQRHEDKQQQLISVEKQLGKANLELKSMAEKIFRLMKQIDELEKHKLQAEEKCKDLEKKNIALNRRVQHTNIASEESKKEKMKLEKAVRNLKNRMDKLQQESSKIKSKYLLVMKRNREMSRNIKGTDTQLQAMSNKHHNALSKLSSQNAQMGSERKQRKKLEEDIKALNIALKTYKDQINNIKNDSRTMYEVLRHRESTLAKLQKKERLFENLRMAVLKGAEETGDEALQSLEDFERQIAQEEMDHEDEQYENINVEEIASRIQRSNYNTTKKKYQSSVSTLLSAPSSNGLSHNKSRSNSRSRSRSRSKSRRHRNGVKTYGEDDLRRQKVELKRLLKSSTGQQLLEHLRSLNITESDLFNWVSSPSELFKGVYKALNKMQEKQGKIHDAFSKSTGEIDSLANKNAELVHLLSAAQEAKTKAIMRLSLMISRLKDGNTSNGQTSLESNSIVDGDYLPLSSNNVDDSEAIIIAKSLRDNKAIRSVDLHDNNIQGNGLMELVMMCISDRCGVESIDLRYNAIRLQDLEVLISFMQKNIGVDDVRAAGLCHERGRSLIPYIAVRTLMKTLTIDLRHNPIFGHDATALEQSTVLNHLHSLLQSCSLEDPPKIVVAQDDELKLPPSKFKSNNHHSSNHTVTNESNSSSPKWSVTRTYKKQENHNGYNSNDNDYHFLTSIRSSSRNKSSLRSRNNSRSRSRNNTRSHTTSSQSVRLKKRSKSKTKERYNSTNSHKNTSLARLTAPRFLVKSSPQLPYRRKVSDRTRRMDEKFMKDTLRRVNNKNSTTRSIAWT